MSDADAAFVHLHVHTAYSLREGALGLGKLIDLAVRDEQPALAVTDSNNLFAALEFSEKAAKAGVQPIAGVQLCVDFDDVDTGGPLARDERFGNIVLLAKTEIGYRNLMRLGSRAYLDPPQGESPHIGLAALAGDSADIIALTGGPDGGVDRAFAAGQNSRARARLAAVRAEAHTAEVQSHHELGSRLLL